MQDAGERTIRKSTYYDARLVSNAAFAASAGTTFCDFDAGGAGYGVLSQLKAFTRELDFMMMPNRGPACSLWQGSAPMQMLHYRPADGLFIFTQGCRHTIITVIFIVGGASLVLITMSAVQRSGWLLQHRKCAFQVLKILLKTFPWHTVSGHTAVLQQHQDY
jgi:hypothetical protein